MSATFHRLHSVLLCWFILVARFLNCLSSQYIPSAQYGTSDHDDPLSPIQEGKKEKKINRFTTERIPLQISDKGIMRKLLLVTIDPMWGEWSPWSKCSVRCGDGGFSVRRRDCVTLPDVPCDGISFDMRPCNSGVKCEAKWQDWGSWGPCSVSCGVGLRARSRICMTGNAEIKCVGHSSRLETCHLPKCQDIVAESLPLPAAEPVASQSVGNNYVVGGAAVAGGVAIPEPPLVAHPKYLGKKSTLLKPYVWGAWGEWSSCSASCGEGNRKRVRMCVDNSGMTPVMVQIKYCGHGPTNQNVGCIGDCYGALPVAGAAPAVAAGSIVGGIAEDTGHIQGAEGLPHQTVIMEREEGPHSEAAPAEEEKESQLTAETVIFIVLLLLCLILFIVAFCLWFISRAHNSKMKQKLGNALAFYKPGDDCDRKTGSQGQGLVKPAYKWQPPNPCDLIFEQGQQKPSAQSQPMSQSQNPYVTKKPATIYDKPPEDVQAEPRASTVAFLPEKQAPPPAEPKRKPSASDNKSVSQDEQKPPFDDKKRPSVDDKKRPSTSEAKSPRTETSDSTEEQSKAEESAESPPSVSQKKLSVSKNQEEPSTQKKSGINKTQEELTVSATDKETELFQAAPTLSKETESSETPSNPTGKNSPAPKKVSFPKTTKKPYKGKKKMIEKKNKNESFSKRVNSGGNSSKNESSSKQVNSGGNRSKNESSSKQVNSGGNNSKNESSSKQVNSGENRSKNESSSKQVNSGGNNSKNESSSKQVNSGGNRSKNESPSQSVKKGGKSNKNESSSLEIEENLQSVALVNEAFSNTEEEYGDHCYTEQVNGHQFSDLTSSLQITEERHARWKQPSQSYIAQDLRLERNYSYNGSNENLHECTESQASNLNLTTNSASTEPSSRILDNALAESETFLKCSHLEQQQAQQGVIDGGQDSAVLSSDAKEINNSKGQRGVKSLSSLSDDSYIFSPSFRKHAITRFVQLKQEGIRYIKQSSSDSDTSLNDAEHCKLFFTKSKYECTSQLQTVKTQETNTGLEGGDVASVTEPICGMSGSYSSSSFLSSNSTSNHNQRQKAVDIEHPKHKVFKSSSSSWLSTLLTESDKKLNEIDKEIDTVLTEQCLLPVRNEIPLPCITSSNQVESSSHHKVCKHFFSKEAGDMEVNREKTSSLTMEHEKASRITTEMTEISTQNLKEETQWFHCHNQIDETNLSVADDRLELNTDLSQKHPPESFSLEQMEHFLTCTSDEQLENGVNREREEVQPSLTYEEKKQNILKLLKIKPSYQRYTSPSPLAFGAYIRYPLLNIQMPDRTHAKHSPVVTNPTSSEYKTVFVQDISEDPKLLSVKTLPSSQNTSDFILKTCPTWSEKDKTLKSCTRKLTSICTSNTQTLSESAMNESSLDQLWKSAQHILLTQSVIEESEQVRCTTEDTEKSMCSDEHQNRAESGESLVDIVSKENLTDNLKHTSNIERALASSSSRTRTGISGASGENWKLNIATYTSPENDKCLHGKSLPIMNKLSSSVTDCQSQESGDCNTRGGANMDKSSTYFNYSTKQSPGLLCLTERSSSDHTNKHTIGSCCSNLSNTEPGDTKPIVNDKPDLQQDTDSAHPKLDLHSSPAFICAQEFSIIKSSCVTKQETSTTLSSVDLSQTTYTKEDNKFSSILNQQLEDFMSSTCWGINKSTSKVQVEWEKKESSKKQHFDGVKKSKILHGEDDSLILKRKQASSLTLDLGMQSTKPDIKLPTKKDVKPDTKSQAESCWEAHSSQMTADCVKVMDKLSYETKVSKSAAKTCVTPHRKTHFSPVTGEKGKTDLKDTAITESYTKTSHREVSLLDKDKLKTSPMITTGHQELKKVKYPGMGTRPNEPDFLSTPRNVNKPLSPVPSTTDKSLLWNSDMFSPRNISSSSRQQAYLHRSCDKVISSIQFTADGTNCGNVDVSEGKIETPMQSLTDDTNSCGTDGDEGSVDTPMESALDDKNSWDSNESNSFFSLLGLTSGSGSKESWKTTKVWLSPLATGSERKFGDIVESNTCASAEIETRMFLSFSPSFNSLVEDKEKSSKEITPDLSLRKALPGPSGHAWKCRNTPVTSPSWFSVSPNSASNPFHRRKAKSNDIEAFHDIVSFPSQQYAGSHLQTLEGCDVYASPFSQGDSIQMQELFSDTDSRSSKGSEQLILNVCPRSDKKHTSSEVKGREVLHSGPKREVNSPDKECGNDFYSNYLSPAHWHSVAIGVPKGEKMKRLEEDRQHLMLREDASLVRGNSNYRRKRDKTVKSNMVGLNRRIMQFSPASSGTFDGTCIKHTCKNGKGPCQTSNLISESVNQPSTQRDETKKHLTLGDRNWFHEYEESSVDNFQARASKHRRKNKVSNHPGLTPRAKSQYKETSYHTEDEVSSFDSCLFNELNTDNHAKCRFFQSLCLSEVQKESRMNSNNCTLESDSKSHRFFFECSDAKATDLKSQKMKKANCQTSIPFVSVLKGSLSSYDNFSSSSSVTPERLNDFHHNQCEVSGSVGIRLISSGHIERSHEPEAKFYLLQSPNKLNVSDQVGAFRPCEETQMLTSSDSFISETASFDYNPTLRQMSFQSDDVWNTTEKGAQTYHGNQIQYPASLHENVTDKEHSRTTVRACENEVWVNCSRVFENQASPMNTGTTSSETDRSSIHKLKSESATDDHNGASSHPVDVTFLINQTSESDESFSSQCGPQSGSGDLLGKIYTVSDTQETKTYCCLTAVEETYTVHSAESKLKQKQTVALTHLDRSSSLPQKTVVKASAKDSNTPQNSFPRASQRKVISDPIMDSSPEESVLLTNKKIDLTQRQEDKEESHIGVNCIANLNETKTESSPDQSLGLATTNSSLSLPYCVTTTNSVQDQKVESLGAELTYTIACINESNNSPLVNETFTVLSQSFYHYQQPSESDLISNCASPASYEAPIETRMGHRSDLTFSLPAVGTIETSQPEITYTIKADLIPEKSSLSGLTYEVATTKSKQDTEKSSLSGLTYVVTTTKSKQDTEAENLEASHVRKSEPSSHSNEALTFTRQSSHQHQLSSVSSLISKDFKPISNQATMGSKDNRKPNLTFSHPVMGLLGSSQLQHSYTHSNKCIDQPFSSLIDKSGLTPIVNTGGIKSVGQTFDNGLADDFSYTCFDESVNNYPEKTPCCTQFPSVTDNPNWKISTKIFLPKTRIPTELSITTINTSQKDPAHSTLFSPQKQRDSLSQERDPSAHSFSQFSHDISDVKSQNDITTAFYMNSIYWSPVSEDIIESPFTDDADDLFRSSFTKLQDSSSPSKSVRKGLSGSRNMQQADGRVIQGFHKNITNSTHESHFSPKDAQTQTSLRSNKSSLGNAIQASAPVFLMRQESCIGNVSNCPVTSTQKVPKLEKQDILVGKDLSLESSDSVLKDIREEKSFVKPDRILHEPVKKDMFLYSRKSPAFKCFSEVKCSVDKFKLPMATALTKQIAALTEFTDRDESNNVQATHVATHALDIKLRNIQEENATRAQKEQAELLRDIQPNRPKTFNGDRQSNKQQTFSFLSRAVNKPSLSSKATVEELNTTFNEDDPELISYNFTGCHKVNTVASVTIVSDLMCHDHVETDQHLATSQNECPLVETHIPLSKSLVLSKVPEYSTMQTGCSKSASKDLTYKVDSYVSHGSDTVKINISCHHEREFQVSQLPQQWTLPAQVHIRGGQSNTTDIQEAKLHDCISDTCGMSHCDDKVTNNCQDSQPYHSSSTKNNTTWVKATSPKSSVPVACSLSVVPNTTTSSCPVRKDGAHTIEHELLGKDLNTPIAAVDHRSVEHLHSDQSCTTRHKNPRILLDINPGVKGYPVSFSLKTYSHQTFSTSLSTSLTSVTSIPQKVSGSQLSTHSCKTINSRGGVTFCESSLIHNIDQSEISHPTYLLSDSAGVTEESYFQSNSRSICNESKEDYSSCTMSSSLCSTNFNEERPGHSSGSCTQSESYSYSTSDVSGEQENTEQQQACTFPGAYPLRRTLSLGTETLYARQTEEMNAKDDSDCYHKHPQALSDCELTCSSQAANVLCPQESSSVLDQKSKQHPNREP